MFRYFEWLIPTLPALAALLNSLPGVWLTRRIRNWIAGGALIGSLLLILPILTGQIIQPGLVGKPIQMPWSNIGDSSQFLPLSFSIVIDPTTTVLMLIVLGGALLIWDDVNHSSADAAAHRQALVGLDGTAAALLAVVMADNLTFLSISWALAGWGIDALVLIRATETGGRLSLVNHLISDMALLLAVGAMSRMVGPTLPATIPATPGTIAAGIWILIAAVARSVLLFSHPAAQTTTQTTLHVLSVTSAIYLIARLDSLLDQVPFLRWLLICWGLLSALGLAAGALYEPQTPHSAARLVLAQGGLLLCGLGLGTYVAVIAFLPAYALIHLSIQPAGRPARHLQWLGLAALAGLPLLPGLTWHAQVFQAAGDAHWAVLVGLALAVLILAAAAGRAAHQVSVPSAPTPFRLPAVSWLMAAALVALGLASLLAPPALSRFLVSVPTGSALRPAWPWYAMAFLIAGLGATPGCLHLLPRAGILGDHRLSRIVAALVARRQRLSQIAGRLLVRAIDWLAGSAEPWLGRQTFDLLARLLYSDESVPPEESR